MFLGVKQRSQRTLVRLELYFFFFFLMVLGLELRALCEIFEPAGTEVWNKRARGLLHGTGTLIL
jgi:hypothetical protein